MLLTFQDAVDSLVDFQGADPSDTVLRDAKKACIEGLREIAIAHAWTYLYKQGRIHTTQGFNANGGTISYQACGGAYPFQVTLTGGTWPSWVQHGLLRIGEINYDVDRQISGTVITLKPPQVPGHNFAGATFGLYQAAYVLPEDFMAQDFTLMPLLFGELHFVHPRDWMTEISTQGFLGDPYLYTIMADRQYHGRLALYLAPFPTYEATIEFLYKRHLKPLRIFKVCAGTVSTAANSQTVVGLGVNFTPDMIGNAVIRVSGVPKLLPTSEVGTNPAVWESKIVHVSTSQQLITQEPCPLSLTNMPYAVSSYVDVETVMQAAFQRRTEYQISINRKAKDRDAAYSAYRIALATAKSADYRNLSPRNAGPPTPYRRRLADMPIDLAHEG